MVIYNILKNPDTRAILGQGAGLIYNSAKEASDENKNFISTLRGNIISEAVASVLFGREAVQVYKVASKVMDGVDKAFAYGREKAIHVDKTGAISVGQLGNKLFKTSETAVTMRQRQLQSMTSDVQNARSMFGSEARKRAMNISY